MTRGTEGEMVLLGKKLCCRTFLRSVTWTLQEGAIERSALHMCEVSLEIISAVRHQRPSEWDFPGNHRIVLAMPFIRPSCSYRTGKAGYLFVSNVGAFAKINTYS